MKAGKDEGHGVGAAGFDSASQRVEIVLRALARQARKSLSEYL